MLASRGWWGAVLMMTKSFYYSCAMDSLVILILWQAITKQIIIVPSPLISLEEDTILTRVKTSKSVTFKDC